jgi:hypothetical protein
MRSWLVLGVLALGVIAGCSASSRSGGGRGGAAGMASGGNGNVFGGGGTSNAGSNGSALTPAQQQGYDAFVAGLPEALCQHYADCGFSSGDDLAACQSEVEEELTDFAVAECAAAQALYASNRAAIDQCLTGTAGSCDNDDFDTFCPGLASIELDEDCGDDEPSGTGGAAGESNSGGGAAGESPAEPAPLTTEQTVVGAWSGGAVCGDSSLSFYYFLCPGGRLRGAEIVGDYEFVACGTFSAVGTTVNTDYGVVAVIDPTFTDESHWQWAYSSSADTLTLDGNCAVEMYRAVGDVTEEDCNSTACTEGGSGPATCGTDCDCGRCWYCESGECRYGGEGPAGCYRGCGF